MDVSWMSGEWALHSTPKYTGLFCATSLKHTEKYQWSGTINITKSESCKPLTTNTAFTKLGSFWCLQQVQFFLLNVPLINLPKRYWKQGPAMPVKHLKPPVSRMHMWILPLWPYFSCNLPGSSACYLPTVPHVHPISSAIYLHGSTSLICHPSSHGI